MNFPLRKIKTTLQILTLSLLIVSSLFPFLSYAQVDLSPSIKFTDYEDLIEYTEDTKTKTIFYKYITETVPQKTDNDWNENILKRESDKEYYVNPTTNETKVKIYSGDNYIKIDNDWLQLEYATTSEEKFFNELEKTVPVETLFEKMVSLLEFFPAKAQTDIIYGSANEGEFNTGWQTNWATARGLTTQTFLPSDGYPHIYANSQFQSSDSQAGVARSSLYYDLSSIADTYCVDSASVFLMGKTKSDNDNDAQAYIAVTEFTPADPGAVASADFNNFSYTTISNTIDITSLATESYSEFTLTATSSINLGGHTNLGLQEGHDIENISPNAQYYTGVRFYDYTNTGTTKDPYLEVSYSDCPGVTEPDPDPTTTTPVYTLPCDMENIDDISIITGCQEVFTDSTSSPSSTIYSYYRIPFFPIIIFVWVFLWVATRLILELIIRWRS